MKNKEKYRCPSGFRWVRKGSFLKVGDMEFGKDHDWIIRALNPNVKQYCLEKHRKCRKINN